MGVVEIHDTNEAKQKLNDALNILDAVSKYLINHEVPRDQLFDVDVYRRLQGIYPRLPSTISLAERLEEFGKDKAKLAPPYHLLQEKGFSEDEIKIFSPYCYKIADSADFDDVLSGLEAHHKMMNAQNLTSKGELLDSILRSGLSKNVRSSIARILDVIGSLAFLHIRDIEAKALATQRGHAGVTKEDISHAATEMWKQLCSYNKDADRKKLDARIFTGIRWDRFRGQNKLGIIVALHKLPLSLKSRFNKLGPILNEIPGVLDRAEKATRCVKSLLDSSLSPWGNSRKRKLSTQLEEGLNLRRKPPVDVNIRLGLAARIIAQPQRTSTQSQKNQTSDHSTTHQCDTPQPDGSSTHTTPNPMDGLEDQAQGQYKRPSLNLANFSIASCEVESQCSDGYISSNASDQSSESAAEAPSQLISGLPQGLETVNGGGEIAPANQQQATNQMDMNFPEFDSLWTSSVNMDDVSTFDNLWNCSHIFDDPASPTDSTTTV